MRLPKFRCKNKIGNWCFFTVLHNGNINEENFDLETLSQFTGLLDKQGVEIYEGDIVKIYRTKSKFYEDIAKIEFYHGAFVVVSVDFEDDRHEPLPKNEWQSIEVIGNIYEHPHLLEANHD